MHLLPKARSNSVLLIFKMLAVFSHSHNSRCKATKKVDSSGCHWDQIGKMRSTIFCHGFTAFTSVHGGLDMSQTQSMPRHPRRENK